MQPSNTQKHSLLHPAHKEWKAEASLAFDQDNPPPKTRGEKIFNALVWGGFGWVANALVSIKLADFATYRFRPYFEEQSTKLAENSIVKSIFKDEAKSFAKSFVSVVTLLPGGYIVTAPIKWFEDQKIGLVKTFDRWFGKSNPNENDKKMQEARYEYIAQQPKISWSNLFSGRTLPVFMVLGTHFAFAKEKANIVNAIAGEGSFRGLDKNYEKMANTVYRGLESKEATRNMLRTQEARWEKGIKTMVAKSDKPHFFVDEKGEALTGKGRAMNYIGNSFVDVGYSGFVAITTFIASHIFAFKSEAKKEQKQVGINESSYTHPPQFQLSTEAENAQTVVSTNTPSNTIAASEHNKTANLNHAPQELRISNTAIG